MRMAKESKLIPVGARLDETLVEKAARKMRKDKKEGFKITWRQLFESGVKDYLEEKTLPRRKYY